MHKGLYFLAGIFMVGLLGNAQPDGFTKVADTSYLKQKVDEVSQQTESISTEFIQEKSLSFLNEKIISNGMLLFKKPDKLRLEYIKPFNYLLIMNGGELLIRNDDNEVKMNLESSKMFGEINDLIISSIQGAVLNMPETTTSFFENNASFFISLEPEQEELKKYIKAIELFISKEDNTVTELKVIELSDDYTLIKFLNKKINEEIPDERFNTR